MRAPGVVEPEQVVAPAADGGRSRLLINPDAREAEGVEEVPVLTLPNEEAAEDAGVGEVAP